MSRDRVRSRDRARAIRPRRRGARGRRASPVPRPRAGRPDGRVPRRSFPARTPPWGRTGCQGKLADSMRLSTRDHDRDSAGLEYVYPVVSRRAGGVSVGINLNPNNACNWRCIYCQVPELVSGMAPPIDVARLERELDGFLDGVLHRRWMEEHVPE